MDPTPTSAEFEFPGDAYAVVGQLVALAGRLPQAIAQAHGLIQREERAGRLRHDAGPERLRATLRELAAAVEWSEECALLLRVALSDAHAALAPLGSMQGGGGE
ncbi:hypothetical protein RM844_27520 [Streptomyces sp. DSM 44915]|uniref:Uncharacterized protein n=1 Tax=Streptomyces chisholmiae TaxID=3075540 RepID=A0ABU2JYK0_9ACTN|nr:hypothetical protein [Streptomyces sp. DSM 44915]MDT0270035.1 hypothetical protein [Streptomyces sp. DSM 44915]